MSESDIQKNIYVGIEKLILIPPTVANICKMLNGTAYILSRATHETVRPKKRKEKDAD